MSWRTACIRMPPPTPQKPDEERAARVLKTNATPRKAVNSSTPMPRTARTSVGRTTKTGATHSRPMSSMPG
eukprot:scaffold29790_cov30-Phaeocystis_antarctica.AAC.1